VARAEGPSCPKFSALILLNFAQKSMKEELTRFLRKITGEEAGVSVPELPEFGHYSTNVAFKIGKKTGKAPAEVAQTIQKIIEKEGGELIEKSEAKNGFINFWIKDEIIQERFSTFSKNQNFGAVSVNSGKKIMVEYTDPNPFKEFHIGHLMTNAIGEAIARLFTASGAEVLRVNYEGDVGLHVAKSIWGILQLRVDMPQESASPQEKSAFLGRTYAAGSKAYEENEAAKAEIVDINQKIYDKSDAEINSLYDSGRKWSLEYFETLYARLGTKFVHYFFESEVGPEGEAIVRAHPEVFKESQGAIIFPGEKYGLHNRVFITSQGLPAYEAKELGLNKKKFEEYHPDESIIVTGNEINDYFKVLLKAMELTLPEVAEKTKHIGHGMLRLPGGKMSSRTGEVITAEALISQVKDAVEVKIKENKELTESDKENIKEKVAISAIKYSILKQGIGRDVIFDLNTSIAFHGDSGPYLQYTYARLNKIVSKAGEIGHAEAEELKTSGELQLMRQILSFPDEITRAVSELAPNHLALYLFELANLANRFYEGDPILVDENTARKNSRLLLSATAARAIKGGLWLLGIEVLERI
jgi:arginyl-tRNA synthetase